MAPIGRVAELGLHGMTPLHKLLRDAEGSDVIRQCWHDVPYFDGPSAIIHLSQRITPSGQQDILLTCLLLTSEADDGNKCKPSKMVVRFSGVTHWEYDYDCDEASSIRLADVFSSPPAGVIAVDVNKSFYILCHSVTVLSCVHSAFNDLDDEKVGP